MPNFKYPNNYDDDFINIFKKVLDYLNDMGYTYEESLQKAQDILKEAKQTNDMNESVQQQINTLIAESGTSDAEVVQARFDAEGNEYPVLKERLDAQDEDVLFTRKTSNAHLEDFWQPPAQPQINSYFSGGDVFARHIYQEWLDLFEGLMEGNEGYITKKTKPNVYQNRYEYPYYEYTPENRYTKTLIIGSGMHGGEKLAVISLYKFLYHLINDWKDYPQLSYIRNNVRLVIVPFQNPYGMAYNTRKVHVPETGEMIDINRNFDYNWDVDPATNPNDANYQGNYPFELTEAVYIREILEEYPDSIGYIDCHNMSQVSEGQGWSTVSYVPGDLPFDESYLIKIKEHLKLEDDDYRIGRLSTSTAFNYAINNFNMHSFCPEYSPGHHFELFSSDEMTHALAFFGNVIIRFAMLTDRSDALTVTSNQNDLEYKADSGSYNRTTANAYVIPTKSGISSSNYEHIVQLNHDFYVESPGVLKYTYSLVLSQSDASGLVFLTPRIFQVNKNEGDFHSGTPLQKYIDNFEVYTRVGSGVTPVMIVALIPVENSDDLGRVTSQIHGYTNQGTATILRFKRLIEFIPSSNESRVNYFTSP